jgi:uncharacterized protein YndB with AHSA1/START domain
MKDQSFTLTLLFDKDPAEVFAAVADVRGWWSRGLDGRSAAAGDQFTYRHGAIHRSVHRVLEAVPGKRMVWSTLDADLSRSKDPREWVGTTITFDLARKGQQTELRFSHVGLVPGLGCFEDCSKGWGYYVGTSLRKLVETGKGTPDSEEVARGA